MLKTFRGKQFNFYKQIQGGLIFEKTKNLIILFNTFFKIRLFTFVDIL